MFLEVSVGDLVSPLLCMGARMDNGRLSDIDRACDSRQP